MKIYQKKDDLLQELYVKKVKKLKKSFFFDIWDMDKYGKKLKILQYFGWSFDIYTKFSKSFLIYILKNKKNKISWF
jgi:hypothetical protein